MSNALKKLFESYAPALDCSRYLERASTLAINKLGGCEGNETIIAAMIIGMAIRESANEIDASLHNICSGINDLTLSGVESAIDELVKAVDDVAYRL